MVDLAPFEEHDRVLVEQFGPKVNLMRRRWWPDRLKLIHERFPSTAGGEEFWEGALKDQDLMGAILRDVLRADLGDPHKDGRRFDIDREDGEKRLAQLLGQDYAYESFRVAFNAMTVGQSRTQVARKTGISRSRVHRLLAGDEQPDRSDLEAIAKGYRKDPSYFREYRTDHILRLLFAGLEEMPEYSVDVYRRLTG